MPTSRKPKGTTKKTTTVIVEPVDGTEDGQEPVGEFELALEQATDLEKTNQVLEDYGIREQSEVNFKIFRIVDGQQRYVFEHPKLDEAFIQRERGGGNYVARLFINGKYKTSVPCPIEDLPDNGNTNAGTSRDSHSAFLEKMVLVLLTKEGHAAGPSITDLTAALANLDNLRGKQESALDTFMKGMEMADRFGGNGGGKLDWKKELFDLAKDNAPAVLGAVNTGLSRLNGGAPVVTPPNPNPPPVQPVPVHQPTPEQMEEQMNFMLRSAIGMMKQQCIARVQVESVIDLVMGNVTNPQYQPIIIQFATLEFEDLVKLDADLGKQPFNEWFKSLHDGLRSELSTPDTVEHDSERNVGDVVNIGRDGKSRKAGSE